jgi:serine/threonine protein kinase
MNARYDMTGETGSMRYMAPEVVESLPYNEKVDVYAFGLLLWEMLQLTRVFDGMSISEFYGRVINGGARPPLDPSWPADIKKLISQCWHADVDRRPNFHQIAERLATVFSEEKGADKIAMSALNLADGVDVKGLLTANSAKRLVRSSTTTNIVPSSKSRGTGGGSGSGEGDEKKKRGFLGKLGKILGGKKGPSAATLVHTAPEAANAQKSQSHGQRSLSSSQIAVPASLANLK